MMVRRGSGRSKFYKYKEVDIEIRKPINACVKQLRLGDLSFSKIKNKNDLVQFSFGWWFSASLVLSPQ